MKGHKGIGIGGNDVRPGLDIGTVDRANEQRAFNQRQRRPFRLTKGRTAPCELAACASIKDYKAVSHSQVWALFIVSGETLARRAPQGQGAAAGKLRMLSACTPHILRFIDL
jgi:hypothetical protein